MQNFFTREDVLAYHQQGVQTIRLDSMPILTDLARETLQTLGMESRRCLLYTSPSPRDA